MRIIINPKYEYLQEQIRHIPELFERKGEVVYDGRNVLKRAMVGDVDVVVKSFKKPHIVNRIVYSFFRKSKAARSYLFSTEIINHGFCSPEPIAMIEQHKCRLLTNSYYVCRYDDGKTVRCLMDGVVAGNEEKLKAFAKYTADLHCAGVLHLDYSPGNILIHSSEGTYYFSLVDVNRMVLLPEIDCDTVCRNMCRLCISREVLAFIMTEYATLRGWDINSTVALSLCYTNQFFKNYVYRRAARKEAAKHIVSFIMVFRLSRSFRPVLSPKSQFACWLWKKEKGIYDIYLQKYDYQKIFYRDYY